MIYRIIYRRENAALRDIKADFLKFDQGMALFILEPAGQKGRIVAIVSCDSVQEIHQIDDSIMPPDEAHPTNWRK